MTMIYSNPAREQESGALPDVEVWNISQTKNAINDCPTCGPIIEQGQVDLTPEQIADACATIEAHDTEHLGWYWQPCFPGCLPDGDPVGPFDTEAEAIADAQFSAQAESDDYDGAQTVGTATDLDEISEENSDPPLGDELPLCVLAMGCSEPCDASESETLPDDDDGAQAGSDDGGNEPTHDDAKHGDDPNDKHVQCHPDCGPIVVHGDGEHAHENEDGRCWHTSETAPAPTPSLYQQRKDADAAWSAELRRLFGKRAGDVRYTAEGKGAPGSKLRELHDAFMVACYGSVDGAK